VTWQLQEQELVAQLAIEQGKLEVVKHFENTQACKQLKEQQVLLKELIKNCLKLLEIN
jgi:hypothetical protein